MTKMVEIHQGTNSRSKSLTGIFLMKNTTTRRENCDCRAWWILAQDLQLLTSWAICMLVKNPESSECQTINCSDYPSDLVSKLINSKKTTNKKFF